jgi:Zn-dependent peptidase ImmA (M78 family)
MRRGFKSRCEQISKTFRDALSLSLDDPLSYTDLAKYLGILVWSIEEIPNLDKKYIKQLIEVDKDEWSALTVAENNKHLIILNPTHSKRRLQNDAMHEISHIILEHEPKDVTPIHNILFANNYDKEIEDEADWLAATLLLPRQGLLSVYRKTMDTSIVANRFGVSTDLVTMRINRTGIKYQLKYKN